MRAAPAMVGWATKAMPGFSRTSRWKLDRPAIIGATMTVSTPASAGGGDLPAHGVEIAREARHIAHRRAARRRCVRSAAATASTRARERRIGLVGEAMVVLDVVDAAARETQREIREPAPGADPCGLSAEQVKARAGAPTRRRSSCSPWRGPPKAFDQLGRKLDIVQRHVVVQRGVAEQHVDELPGIAADGLGGERDANLEQAVFLFGDASTRPTISARTKSSVDRRQRHLDALLDRDGACARLDRSGVAADVVDRLQTRGHGAL